MSDTPQRDLPALADVLGFASSWSDRCDHIADRQKEGCAIGERESSMQKDKPAEERDAALSTQDGCP